MVAAAEVYQDYRANGVAADKKYLNHWVRVVGRVRKVDPDLIRKGEYVLRLETGDRLHTVDISFPAAASGMDTLRAGDWAVIDAVGDRKVIDPQFKDGHGVGRFGTEEEAVKAAKERE